MALLKGCPSAALLVLLKPCSLKLAGKPIVLPQAVKKLILLGGLESRSE